MTDPPSVPNIASTLDRGNGRPKENLSHYLKMPHKDISMIKDPGDVGTEYTDPLHWTRRDKYIWFFTLLAGTTACYSARTTMPLVAPSISTDMKWSKTEVSSIYTTITRLYL